MDVRVSSSEIYKGESKVIQLYCHEWLRQPGRDGGDQQTLAEILKWIIGDILYVEICSQEDI